MKRTYTSNIALACQVFALSAGLSLAAPVQDRDASGQVTADQQKSNKTDRELTQEIREAVVADKSLSMSAHNVKIISRNGTVTLRGKVKSEAEKKAIEDKATETAGSGNVTSELTVSSK
jgi:hyperosmotically inducible periplasmic protein